MRDCSLALLVLAGTACGRVAPPQPAAPRTATTVTASQARTWDAVIDVFAERNIPIRTMERVSGFISTEQLGVNPSEAKEWADCGESNWSSGTRVNKEGKEVGDFRIGANRAIYNVLVRGDSGFSTVKTTVRWTLVGPKAKVTECSTSGVWEAEAEGDIKRRAEGHSNASGPISSPSQSPAQALPSGTKWVADANAKMYYSADCPMAMKIAPADRLYYSSETALQTAGFKRAERC